MHHLRAFFLRHRATAFAVLALALAMKVLMPAGTMIGGSAHTLTVQICDGYGDAAHDAAHGAALSVAIPVKGRSDTGKPGPDHQACPFSALGHAALTGADPVLLAAALVFLLVLGLAASIVPAPRPQFRLRPPLRAPPALG